MTNFDVFVSLNFPMLLSAAEPTQKSGGGMSMMLMMVAMVGIMYFVMIRPRQQQEKALAKQRDAMKIGDGVVTIGGMHGIITNKNDSKSTITVRVAEGAKIKFDKSAIAKVIPTEKGGSDESEDGEDENGEDKD